MLVTRRGYFSQKAASGKDSGSLGGVCVISIKAYAAPSKLEAYEKWRRAPKFC